MYDDSRGWYDHQMGPIVNPSAATSNDPADADQSNAPGKCGNGASLAENDGDAILGHCGYGPRVFVLVISSRANENFVDDTVTDQSSALGFIEDKWQASQLGNGSFEQLVGLIDNMVDFDRDGGDDAHEKLANGTTNRALNA
jgi:phospholipase C